MVALLLNGPHFTTQYPNTSNASCLFHWLCNLVLLLCTASFRHNSPDSFIVVKDKSSAHINVLCCQRQGYLVSWMPSHTGNCTDLKQGFLEGERKGFLINCILQKLSLNQKRGKKPLDCRLLLLTYTCGHAKDSPIRTAQGH